MKSHGELYSIITPEEPLVHARRPSDQDILRTLDPIASRKVNHKVSIQPIFGTLGHESSGFTDHSFCLNSGRRPMEICPGR
jgi:hypothetical protein